MVPQSDSFRMSTLRMLIRHCSFPEEPEVPRVQLEALTQLGKHNLHFMKNSFEVLPSSRVGKYLGLDPGGGR